MQTYNGLKRFYLRIDSKNSFKHQRLVIIVTIDDETLKISELVNVLVFRIISGSVVLVMMRNSKCLALSVVNSSRVVSF